MFFSDKSFFSSDEFKFLSKDAYFSKLLKIPNYSSFSKLVPNFSELARIFQISMKLVLNSVKMDFLYISLIRFSACFINILRIKIKIKT